MTVRSAPIELVRCTEVVPDTLLYHGACRRVQVLERVVERCLGSLCQELGYMPHDRNLDVQVHDHEVLIRAPRPTLWDRVLIVLGIRDIPRDMTGTRVIVTARAYRRDGAWHDPSWAARPDRAEWIELEDA